MKNGICIENLRVRFGMRQALGIEKLELEPGRVIAVLGPNGAGKSTLLRMLCGIVPFQEGRVFIEGLALADLNPAQRSFLSTYVGSELETEFPMTALDAVQLGRYSHARADTQGLRQVAVEEIMRETGSWDLRDSSLEELSSGERQRVQLARALVQDARWVCLDESFSRLDLHHQAMMGALLKRYAEKGTSFLWVSHDLNLSSDWCDRVLLMKEGEAFAYGPTREVLNESNLRALYPEGGFVLSAHPVSGALKVHFSGE
jgi:iron complex transport system ATP-binding protein